MSAMILSSEKKSDSELNNVNLKKDLERNVQRSKLQHKKALKWDGIEMLQELNIIEFEKQKRLKKLMKIGKMLKTMQYRAKSYKSRSSLGSEWVSSGFTSCISALIYTG